MLIYLLYFALDSIIVPTNTITRSQLAYVQLIFVHILNKLQLWPSETHNPITTIKLKAIILRIYLRTEWIKQDYHAFLQKSVWNQQIILPNGADCWNRNLRPDFPLYTPTMLGKFLSSNVRMASRFVFLICVQRSAKKRLVNQNRVDSYLLFRAPVPLVCSNQTWYPS